MSVIKTVWLTAILFFSTITVAHSSELSGSAPHDKIAKTTEQLLVLIKEAKTYFDDEPERFYGELRTIINPLIDFKSFTRSVMGDYGTKAYYQSLDKKQRAAYKEDYSRFVTRFQDGLINTYGKGLLAFNGQKIHVEPPTQADLDNVKARKSVDVLQKIYGSDKTFTITYKMRPNKSGDWLLRNVSIESINVGQLYRNQFSAAMSKESGDFSAVIDNWVVAAKDLDESAKDEDQKR